MQFLELVEGCDDVLVFGELLGCLAKCLLSLEILAEVEVTQVASYLDHIVEFLHVVLVAVVYVAEGRCRNRTCLTPPFLQAAECRELRAYVIAVLDEGLEFLDDGLLLCKVLLSLGLLLLVKFGSLLFIVGVERLEILFYDVERVVACCGLCIFRYRLGRI